VGQLNGRKENQDPAKNQKKSTLKKNVKAETKTQVEKKRQFLPAQPLEKHGGRKSSRCALQLGPGKNGVLCSSETKNGGPKRGGRTRCVEQQKGGQKELEPET